VSRMTSMQGGGTVTKKQLNWTFWSRHDADIGDLWVNGVVSTKT
jgi:hypothetical protein